MKTRKLHHLSVSEVGMGCMAFSHGYGQIPEEAYSIEAILSGYEHGCAFFDTAEVYSPGLSGIGHNERIVGKALKGVRENVILATKLFLDVGPGGSERELKKICKGAKVLPGLSIHGAEAAQSEAKAAAWAKNL